MCNTTEQDEIEEFAEINEENSITLEKLLV